MGVYKVLGTIFFYIYYIYYSPIIISTGKTSRFVGNLQLVTIFVIMDPASRPFGRVPIPVYRYGGNSHTKIKCSCQEMAKEKFISREGRVNWSRNSHVTIPSSISLKSKTPDLSNLSDYHKVRPFVKILFKRTRETFPLATPYQPQTSIRTNQV